jgi:hypothetical protein
VEVEETGEKGCSDRDNYIINSWTYDRFTEARVNRQLVTTQTWQQWGMAASFSSYLQGSVLRHLQVGPEMSWRITISGRGTWQNILAVRIKPPLNKQRCWTVSKQTTAIIPDHDLDYVINTDQTGCEYCVNIRQILSHKGEKTRDILEWDINKITHSYIAQYTITASGKLLPTVLICLQERSGEFDPCICEEIWKCFCNCYKVEKAAKRIHMNAFWSV